MDSDSTFPHFSTLAIHIGSEPEQWTSRCIVPPISLGTTYKQDAPGEHRGYDYSRGGNPSRTCLEKCLAALEGAKYGFTFSSGLAATSMVIHLLESGDHIISMNDVYGGSNRYFTKVISKMGIETTFVDCNNLDSLRKSIKQNTKLVWIETPTNPTMQLVDIQAVCNLAHEHKGVFVVVDNTFMSAYFQRPLELGADITMHSLTKYMNGHSDVVMGALMTSNEDFAKRLAFLQMAMGAVPSAFDCFLVHRGLKTLSLRMKEHMKNGLLVAKFLESSSRVLSVTHPGLPSHPQFELGKKQMKGYSGMVTFFIKGGLEAAKTFLKSCKVFTLAESLGGYESLAEHPAIMTHASVDEEHRDTIGISDNLIRLSVGLEDVNDLISDLDQALKAALP